MKILYVEDHSAQRDIMREMLELAGYEVMLAATGEESIVKTNEIRPNVILMDLRMPGMGGLEAIKKLKGDPAVADIPIIVISAWASRVNRKETLEAGAVKFIAKPIDIGDLVQQINEVAGGP